MASNKRRAVFVVNRNRQEAIDAELKIKSLLTDFDFVEESDAEIVIVLGGDGTILRGAVVARRLNVPLLGINLGRVGFMAEVEKSSFEEIAKAIIDKSYSVDPRLVLEYHIERSGKKVASGWALNEVTIECEQGTMIELLLQIDGRPISSWWADGLIVATPTGSTAYAFSVGGPIIWPQTDALVVTPIAAHALFTRPLVIPPSSEIAIDILSEDGIVKADALRFEGLLVGDRVIVNRAMDAIQLAHVRPTSFSDRLVAKFKLPIEGWRGE
ncbi:MAG: NAD kinase [Candidatus Nanopelagicaceae bacterium]